MYLFKVWNSAVENPHISYYWATDTDQAKAEFLTQIHTVNDDPGELEAEQVWANNRDLRYRGYVVKEDI